MVEGERPPLILRRIQSYDPDWPSSDDYTVHVDEGDQSVGRIFWRYAAHPEGLPWPNFQGLALSGVGKGP